MRISVRLRLGQPAEPAVRDDGVPAFRLLPAHRSSLSAPLIASATLHLATFLLLPQFAASFVSDVSPEVPSTFIADARRAGRLILYLPKSPVRTMPETTISAPRGDPPRREAGRYTSSVNETAPSTLALSEPASLLLRPSLQIEKGREMLPAFAVWNGETAAPPDQPVIPRRKEFAAPPAAAPRPSPQLVVQPTDIPFGEMPLPRLSATGKGPVLAAAAAFPISRVGPPPAPAVSALDLPSAPKQGGLAAAISISSFQPAAEQTVRIPLNSQQPASGTPAAREVGTAGAESRTLKSGSGSPPGRSAGTAVAQGTAASGAAHGPIDGKEAGPAVEYVLPAYGGSIRVRQDADGMRVLTYPSNGQFDVVVQEARLPDEITGPEIHLPHKPVYTVYLNVGEDREWILQYCLVSEDSKPPSTGGMVITLGPEPSIRPPFIQKAAVPQRAMGGAAKYLLFRGLLTSAGRLERFHSVGSETPDHQLLASSFTRWQFRPALRDDRPANAEVLLVVPPLQALSHALTSNTNLR